MGFNYYTMAFQRISDFQGVSNRPEYWYFTLWNVIFALTIMLIFGEGSIPDVVYSIAVLIPGIALAIRRMHDVDKSGWHLLWTLTGIGAFWVLYLACQPSVSSSRFNNQLSQDEIESDEDLEGDEIEEVSVDLNTDDAEDFKGL
tara:strand:- start:334 stop:765 length:432 start_codon:yes stop_codon:yes gene_type:complete